jgi:hypothetical protein
LREKLNGRSFWRMLERSSPEEERGERMEARVESFVVAAGGTCLTIGEVAFIVRCTGALPGT